MLVIILVGLENTCSLVDIALINTFLCLSSINASAIFGDRNEVARCKKMLNEEVKTEEAGRRTAIRHMFPGTSNHSLCGILSILMSVSRNILRRYIQSKNIRIIYFIYIIYIIRVIYIIYFYKKILDTLFSLSFCTSYTQHLLI